MAGLAFLALTNWSRFGSPTEFGHRLSATSGIIVFMTRIDNPMKEATVVQAGRELFGWLFLMKVRGVSPGEDNVPGRAPFKRWRDRYMTTFSPVWAAVVGVSLIGSTFWLLRQRRAGLRVRQLLKRPGRALVLGPLVWGALSTLGLASFYLHFPNMSSRYLLDFAPAFTALALLIWLGLSRRLAWLPLIVLAGWLGYKILTAQVRSSALSLRTRMNAPIELQKSEGRRLDEFAGTYSATNHPSQTAIRYNGYGWDKGAGDAGNIVILAVDRPEFVEVVAGFPEYNTNESRSDFYRAVMDGQLLPLREVQQEGDQVRVHFDIPEDIRRRGGEELVFLCFTEGYDKSDRESWRPLYSVRWR